MCVCVWQKEGTIGSELIRGKTDSVESNWAASQNVSLRGVCESWVSVWVYCEYTTWSFTKMVPWNGRFDPATLKAKGKHYWHEAWSLEWTCPSLVISFTSSAASRSFTICIILWWISCAKQFAWLCNSISAVWIAQLLLLCLQFLFWHLFRCHRQIALLTDDTIS